MIMRKGLLSCFLIFSISLLTACSSSFHKAPVHRLKGKAPRTSGYVVVKKNENLFQIAKRSGHDYQKLAQLNNINPPYSIYPGQKIYFSKNHQSFQGMLSNFLILPKEKEIPIVKPKKNDMVKFYARNFEGSENNKVNVSAIPEKKKEVSPPFEKEGPGGISGKVIRWQWPVIGKLLRTSASHKNSKGIDIGGSLGQPIKAAAGGTIVYSGNALKGYGNLIIIKHNENFLSAYAHNDKLMVKEGDHVTFGQTIATMGKTGSSDVKLHFEIRHQGKPVDPLKFLPKH